MQAPALGRKRAKTVLGLALVTIGFLIPTGADKQLQTFLVTLSPDWRTTLTTRS
jgi:cytochrome c-type biogenesis protein